jgi:hypothetical protein
MHPRITEAEMCGRLLGSEFGRCFDDRAQQSAQFAVGVIDAPQLAAGSRVVVVFMTAVEHNQRLRKCSSYTKCADSPDSVRRMVTAKTQYSLDNAREYFEEHLWVGDYYDEG